MVEYISHTSNQSNKIFKSESFTEILCTKELNTKDRWKVGGWSGRDSRTSANNRNQTFKSKVIRGRRNYWNLEEKSHMKKSTLREVVTSLRTQTTHGNFTGKK